MEIMSDPNWSEFPNPSECFKKLELESKLKKFKLVLELFLKLEKLESYLKMFDVKFNLTKLKNLWFEQESKLWLEQESKLGHMEGFFSGLKSHAKKFKATLKKSSLTNFLLDPGLRLILLYHSKRITSKGEHKALEELQQSEQQLQDRQEIFFEKINGGDWHNGEIIENEFEDLKLSLKILEMLKHLVQSTLIEPMRDAVVLMTLMYIVVLSYSLAQVRNDWLIHFLVLCAFFCLHIGSYFSEKAANYFYRVKEMEKKSMERWPHDVVLYLHFGFSNLHSTLYINLVLW